jgi:hypothetical protein
VISDSVTVMILLGAHGCDMLERTAPVTCLEVSPKAGHGTSSKEDRGLHRGGGHGRLSVLLDVHFPFCLSD